MTIDQDRDALLLIDLQVDFMPGGALAVARGNEVVPIANALARQFEHVIVTQDWHPAGHVSFASSHAGKQPYESVEAAYGRQTLWPDHCVQGTAGAGLHIGLEVSHAELLMRKGFRRGIDSYSAFLENDHVTPTGLAGYLRERGLRRLFLAGLAYDFCVRYTAEDGTRLGFECVVVEDACRAVGLGDSVAETDRVLANAGVLRVGAADLL